MNDIWFKEEREAHKGDRAERDKQIEETRKVLENSTIFRRRMKRIIYEEIQKTYAVEEDYTGHEWERRVLAGAAQRKALKRLMQYLD